MRETVTVVALVLAAACRADSGRVSENRAPVGTAAVAPAPSAGCHAGEVPALVGERRQLVVDGQVRSYLVDAPAGSADEARPLVLAFHGFRHSAAGLRAGIGLAERAAAGTFVAIHAEGREDVALLNTVGRGWDTAPDETRDLAFVRALLDAIEQERCIDRRRIFATGMSNGGFLVNLLGCQLADRLAAVAPVAGARPLDACQPAAPIPILFFYGTADPIVPPRLTIAARAWWRRANQCDGSGEETRDGCQAARDCAADVVVCAGTQGHTWPTGATDRIWAFFAAHPRPAAPGGRTP